MKSFKRIIKSSFAIVLAFIMLFSVACKKDPVDPGDTPPDLGPNSISFYKSSLDLTVGDKESNVALVYRTVEGQTLVYQSANPEIAKVSSSGVVEAINEGQTKIIATYGDISNEYPVRVTYLDSVLPSIETNQASESFNLVKDSTFVFEPTIKYNDGIFSDGEFTYEVEKVGSVDAIVDCGDGVFNAVENGQARITIRANWRKFTSELTTSLVKQYTITVVDDVVISVEGVETDFVQVYTKQSFGGSNYNTAVSFVPVVLTNGEPTNENVVVEIEDPSIATYESATGKIVAQSFGSTVATIKVARGSEIVERQYQVFVERPVAKFGKTVNYFSSVKGNLRDEESNFENITLAQFIYGSDSSVEIIDASVNGLALEVEENKIFGITGSTNSTYQVTVNVGTATEIYKVDMVVYGAYIYSLEDLDVFIRGEDDRELNCYVELANDLDAKDITLRKHFSDNETSDFVPTSSKSYKQIKGFRGTFDGKGHTIKNLTTGKYGLMCVTYEATIKNVGFENVNINGGGLFAENIMFTEFENVYVKVASMAEEAGGSNVFSKFVVRAGNFKNIYVDALAIERDQYKLTGALAAIENIPNATPPIFENCFILADLPMGVNVSVVSDTKSYLKDTSLCQLSLAENVYVKQDEKLVMMDYLWNNMQFLNAKDNFENAYLEKNPEKTPTSEAISALEKVYKLDSVRSYTNVEAVKADVNTQAFFKGFIGYDCWSMLDGVLYWGETKLNAEDGQIYLNVGSVAGKPVEGFDSNPITPALNSQVKLNKLTCFGYKFIGWKDYRTAEIFYADDNLDYVLVSHSYSGEAMEFVAVWEKDPNVSTGPVFPV